MKPVLSEAGPLLPPDISPPPPLEVPLISERLKLRMRKYGIVLPSFAPIYDRVFVYPTDDLDQEEKIGELYVAQSTKNRMGAQRGVLMMAGAKAIEELFSHGISVGDMVLCARFSTWDRSYIAEGRLHRMMVLRSAEIVGSEDLREAYQRGDMRLVMDHEGHVRLHDRERIDPPDNEEM